MKCSECGSKCIKIEDILEITPTMDRFECPMCCNEFIKARTAPRRQAQRGTQAAS